MSRVFTKLSVVRIAPLEEYVIPDGWRLVSSQPAPGYAGTGHVLLILQSTGDSDGPYRSREGA